MATAAAVPNPPPFRRLPQKGPDITVDHRDDGTILIRSNHAMAEPARSIPHLMAERAALHPDRPWLMQRAPGHGPWQGVTYGEGKRMADSVAQWLLDRGLGAGDAVMCLSANSVAQGILMVGCFTAGVPIAPLSPAYSLVSTDHAKLKHCFATVRPRIVFAEQAAMFERAFDTLRALDPSLVFVTVDGGAGTIPFRELTDTVATEAVNEAREALTHDTVGKYLFTSGSTGMPKGVPQHQGMFVNLIAASEGLRDDPDPVDHPISLDWMPWNHISAGTIHFNAAIAGGGTLYIDEGKPVPGLFETTIANLREISPMSFGSAPIAFAMLADAMERDPTLRHAFFKNLRGMGYGGATLSDDLYDRMQALAIAETGERMPFTTMYGATETLGVTVVHWASERVGLIGLPLPGSTLKLVPSGDKLEVRVKGPTVTTGYHNDPEKTAAAFDEEGYYMLGDAARFLDPDQPELGLVFDGRVTEDFKLSSGTWVSVGTLRPDIVAACSPYLQDAVIAGQDKPFIAVLAWPSASALQTLAEATPGADPFPTLEGLVKEKLEAFNAEAGGSSRRVGRFTILRTAPSIDGGEITDKGYVNQRATLTARADIVKALFADEVGEHIIDLRG
ncbi:AMP-binding protein [Sphingomonas sp. TZW2008]|uniref:AMP-binding protein n=1 Tax=Sphingomonas sp. TZW2008 TaxID=1917973 RepID=UPI000A26D6E2|nr:AMP-binding protein [Sphingomonas sp. TZW2008]